MVTATSTTTTSTNTTNTTGANVQATSQSNLRAANPPVAVTSSDVSTSEFAASVSGKVTAQGLFTTYWYEYGLTADNLGSKTAVQNIGSSYEPLNAPAYISGLSKSTKYFFVLVAENQLGRMRGSQYSFSTNSGNPAPVGSLPTIKTLVATGVAKAAAQLNGEVTPNNASTVYWFEYGKTTDFGQTSPLKTISADSQKTSVSLSLASLEPATNYYFRLNAQNQWGTVNGLTISFKTPTGTSTAKPSVETKNANSISSSNATVRGTVNPNGLDTTYWFEYSTDSLLGNALLKSTERKSFGAGTSDVAIEANVTNLTAKTNYFYRAVAQNTLGITYGDRVAFKTK